MRVSVAPPSRRLSGWRPAHCAEGEDAFETAGKRPPLPPGATSRTANTDLPPQVVVAVPPLDLHARSKYFRKPLRFEDFIFRAIGNDLPAAH